MDGATVPRFSTVPSRIVIHGTEGHFFRCHGNQNTKNILNYYSVTHMFQRIRKYHINLSFEPHTHTHTHMYSTLKFNKTGQCMYNVKLRCFRVTVFAENVCFDFLYNFCLKLFSFQETVSEM